MGDDGERRGGGERDSFRLLHSLALLALPSLEETLSAFSLSLFGLALTLEAATSCAVLAAMSCDATTSSSNLPVPVTTLSAASLQGVWKGVWFRVWFVG